MIGPPKRQALAVHQKVVTEKDEQIQALNFELDKYRRYIFGKKNEKLASIHTDENQINLFELGPTSLSKKNCPSRLLTLPKKKLLQKNVRRARAE